MSNWYYDKKGKKIGPVSVETLRSLLEVGTVHRQTLAWNDRDEGQWRALQTFAEFGVPSAPPPLPMTVAENKWARLIALWPCAAAGILYFLSRTSANSWLTPSIVMALNALPYLLFAAFDQKSLRNRLGESGLKPAWVLIPPVYLFKRANRLGQPKTLVWVYGLAVAAALFSTYSRSNGVRTVSVPACGALISKSQVESLFNQLAANVGVTAVSADAISETAFAAGQRTCTTTVRASDGQRYPSTFTITPRNGQVYYELRIRN